MNFVTSIQDHRHGTLAALGEFMRRLPKAHIGSLTLAQICAFPLAPHGIYFMFDYEGVPWYIGMASSRTFGTRLSAHFDQNENAMLNTVPRKIRQQGIAPDYDSALKLGLDLHLNILSVPIRSVNGLENALRSLLQPQLNPCKHFVDPKTVVAHLLPAPPRR